LDSGFSGGQAVLSKFETNSTRREWRCSIDGSTLDLRLLKRDESASVETFRETDANFPTDEVLLIVGTDDGSGGATAADGMAIYLRGVVEASTATNNASYVAMENDIGVVELGKQDGNSAFWTGNLGTLFFTHRVLNGVEVFNLNDIYVAMQRADRSQLLAGVF